MQIAKNIGFVFHGKVENAGKYAQLVVLALLVGI